MAPRRPTAIVVGGSLAGLMTALTLSRVGVHVTVLERSGLDRSRGAGILVPDGLLGRLAGRGRRDTELPILTGGMQSWHTIFAALHAAVDRAPQVTVLHSTRVTRVHEDDEAAQVRTADGRTFTADMVVGADGHRSLVRAAVAPARQNATFAGYVVWLASIDEQDLPVVLHGDRRIDSGFFAGDDLLLAAGPFPGSDGQSVRGHRTIGWAMYDNTHNEFLLTNGNVRGTVVHHSVAAEEIPAHVAHDLRRMIEQRWPAPWKEAMLASLDAGLVIGTPISEYVPDRLVHGRLALVGDAAHVATPMTGRGFTEALEDAEALAAALESGRPVSEALARYEKKRLPAARGTVQSGQTFSRRFRPAA